VTIGHCKHGEFELEKGCPECIAERRQAGNVIEGTLPPDQAAEAYFTPLGTEGQIDNALTITRPESDVTVMTFYAEAVKLREYAEARVITTIADLKPANDDLNIIRRLKKAMEARRKEYLAPFQDHVKEVNEAYKRLMEPVDIADKITTDKMLAFNREQERIHREQEEINRLREQAAQKQKELTGEITEVEVVEVAPEAPHRIETEVGTSGMAKIKKWEVENIELVPREYLIIDAVKIGKVVRAGIPSIPGIRIYEDTILKTSMR